MLVNPMMYMTAGLMLTAASADSTYRLSLAAKPITIPRWLPYAALAVLAVASAVTGAIYPEAIGGNID